MAKYPAAQRVFTETGDYVGYIAATHSGSHSAAFWEVDDTVGKEPAIGDGGISQGDSTYIRGLLRALLRILEVCACGSNVMVWTTAEHLSDGAHRWLSNWKANGWKASAGKLANADLWQQIDQVWVDKQLMLKVCRPQPGSPEEAKVASVQAQAKRLLFRDAA